MKFFITLYRYLIYRGLYSAFLLVFHSLKEWIIFPFYRKSSIKIKDFQAIEKNLDNKKHATFYCPTPIKAFLKLIQSIDLPAQPVFVDYGAGKARAMFLASESGFQKIKGLEFSPYLYEEAKKNIKEYVRKNKKNSFQLLNIDVCDYAVQKEDNFFYFFHPFNEKILDKCLKNIYKSLKENPRFCILVYHSNTLDQTSIITQKQMFQLQKTFQFSGSFFYIYQTVF